MNTRNVLSLPSANPRNPELLEEMGLAQDEPSSTDSNERRRKAPAKPHAATSSMRAPDEESVPGLEPKLIEKKIRVSSYFTPEEHWRLRMLALKQNMSVSDYLRSLALAEQP